jgi:hypothetical protein
LVGFTYQLEQQLAAAGVTTAAQVVQTAGLTLDHPLLTLASTVLDWTQVDSPAGSTSVSNLGGAPRAGYQPIASELGQQRRLRVTRGIYLPADIPMHGIFGSKDVIHSWAIPGLGVKIDCIPGYSSHRRLIFRWRGLYWGQCMEVCGRYHHWMPLLIRIVHKDVFLVWCLAYLRVCLAQAGGGVSYPSVETARAV